MCRELGPPLNLSCWVGLHRGIKVCTLLLLLLLILIY